jgi:hypothetical protein
MIRWAALVIGLVGATVLGTLAATRVSITATGIERPRPRGIPRDASLAQQVAAVDAAIAAADRSRAAYAWRDAYGLALRARDWKSMITVGDAALRIDRLGDEQTAFRAEARQAYLLALFRARDAGAPEGVQRVADAFAALGDQEMAARARTVQPKGIPR